MVCVEEKQNIEISTLTEKSQRQHIKEVEKRTLNTFNSKSCDLDKIKESKNT